MPSQLTLVVVIIFCPIIISIHEVKNNAAAATTTTSTIRLNWGQWFPYLLGVQWIMKIQKIPH